MEHTRLVVEGRWVNRGCVGLPKWQLMVHPVVIKSQINKGYAGCIVLGDMDLPDLPIVDSQSPKTIDLTLHNFGQYSCNEGFEWQLLLTTPVPFIKDTAFEAQRKNGYVFLEDIKPKDTEDDLDMWIFESLSSLTGPRTISFTKES
ncbi:hypothetical protein ST201phi2-1p368 [Pseudomonas phage 201phi2-1]|uniref:Uncharacterized protein n=1 Tax=Pseudomonas phage 201phi2-1 TaxID=198110 RepID=B3FJM8_BP201|nr:hypothetical protein ST201phi2-1p368 [Pseudomonas phage 201phi2-1]ABY63193.1 hypothetical protein 201phi2-1p368 [Pseudomonas phage 201phi2-1]